MPPRSRRSRRGAARRARGGHRPPRRQAGQRPPAPAPDAAAHVPCGAGGLRNRVPRRRGAGDDAGNGDGHRRLHLAGAGARTCADARIRHLQPRPRSARSALRRARLPRSRLPPKPSPHACRRSPTIPGRLGIRLAFAAERHDLDRSRRATRPPWRSRCAARELDAAPAEPEATMALAVAAAQLSPAIDSPADEPTMKWSAVDASAAAGTSVGLPSSRRDARRGGAVLRRRRRQRAVGAAALTAAVGVIGLTVWFGSAAPDPQPTPLPQLEQTVNTSDEQTVPVLEPAPAIEPAVDPAPAPAEDVRRLRHGRRCHRARSRHHHRQSELWTGQQQRQR